MRIELILKDISDIYVRENFLRLRRYLQDLVLLRSQWRFMEITYTSAVTNAKYRHNLGYKPNDIIQTAVSNGATVTWNYDNFDATNLDITTSGACTIRAYVGTYREEP